MLEPIHRKHRNPFSYPTQAQIRRAVDAVKKSGLKVGGVEIRPDGTISVLSHSSLSTPDKLRELFFDEN